MILSYHPCFVADQNRICAGRQPNREDLSDIKKADAVVLPQGCMESLYRLAKDHCPNIFPNYDIRFEYPGKIGQARLFKKMGAAHPATITFPDVRSLTAQYPLWKSNPPLPLPFVFKFDWGGEGKTVFMVESVDVLSELTARAVRFEKTGQSGFLFQEYIPSTQRSLRVAAIGSHMVSYWRVQENPETFHTSLARGGSLDMKGDPHLQKRARDAVTSFCRESGINLAGFDLLFSGERENPEPVFLEINWFFGRKGLGGSEKYYDMLVGEIRKWISGLNSPGVLS